MSTHVQTAVKVTALVAGGAVIGAGLGLLFAPQPGTDTRRQIRQYAKRAQVQATRLSRNVKAGVDRAIESGRSLVPRREQRPVVEAA
ncbi:MAG: YtxH domain-containing protein [Nitrospiraceae bacterium]